MTTSKALQTNLLETLLWVSVNHNVFIVCLGRHGYPDPESVVKTVNIDSSHSAHEQQVGLKIWRFDIAKEECRSARVHLQPFDMAPGDHVIIYGIDSRGNRVGVERYNGKGLHDYGQVNSRRVWAKQLVIESHAKSNHSHFILQYLHYADCYHMQQPLKPEVVCGQKDWKNIACYETLPKVFELGPSVFRLRFINNGSAKFCTAYKASDDGRFLTNWHCLRNRNITLTGELDYEYAAATCAGTTAEPKAVYHVDKFIRTSYSEVLDYTIFTVRENTTHINCLRSTSVAPNTSEIIFIIHHPLAEIKKVSIKSDMDVGGYCKIQPTCIRSNDFCYFCDTEHGSSGAPVFYKFDGQMSVFSLNHGSVKVDPAECPNAGVKMSLILDDAKEYLGVCSSK